MAKKESIPATTSPIKVRLQSKPDLKQPPVKWVSGDVRLPGQMPDGHFPPT